ncbi:Uncharacterized protein Fot_55249 [Forsythia ovata]|uniref:Uncharacterized protein n=1 Tax=Forsythia ovata TaxID=205694 RepID=A0ABD1P6I3_9LAMI
MDNMEDNIHKNLISGHCAVVGSRLSAPNVLNVEWAKDNSGCLLRTRPEFTNEPTSRLFVADGAKWRRERLTARLATHNVRNRVAPVTGGWATTNFGCDGSCGMS